MPFQETFYNRPVNNAIFVPSFFEGPFVEKLRSTFFNGIERWRFTSCTFDRALVRFGRGSKRTIRQFGRSDHRADQLLLAAQQKQRRGACEFLHIASQSGSRRSNGREP